MIAKFRRLFLTVLALFVCSDAFALTLQGTVHLVGSALRSRTLLETTDPQQATTVICQSDLEQKIRHLTDLQIQIDGEWKVTTTGQADCLQVNTFRVLKASSGRPIITGVLTSRRGQFIITDDDGAEVVLAELPSGARDLLGRKVIFDVKSIASSSNAEALKVVVSFRPMP
ncbi:MAG: hypothetical protein FJ146_03835 [Deltaproteobacteria bacterium]|nr:hypothetical protein [Deltaproteobacteria bacterium]